MPCCSREEDRYYAVVGFLEELGIVAGRSLDQNVERLCSALKSVDVVKYSLELQIWWRDHQIADRKQRSITHNKPHLGLRPSYNQDD